MSKAATTEAGHGGAPDHGGPSVVSNEGDASAFVVSILGCNPISALDPAQVDSAHQMLVSHRLEGLARMRGLGSSGSVNGDPDQWHTSLEPAYRRQQIGTGLVLDASERARSALSDAGIECIEFKGAALLRAGLYGDPGARPMDDADVLVRPADARRAGEVLVAAGFEPWCPWQDAQTEWLDSFTLSAPEASPAFPTAIDLHWRTAYGSLRFGESEVESLLWGGADLERQLPKVARHLLVVAEHLLKHVRVKPHLLAYADLARLAGAVEDWDDVIGGARGRFFGPAVGVLLDVVRTDLGGQVPTDAIGEFAPRSGRVWRIRERLRPAALLYADRTPTPAGRVGGLRWRRDLAPSARALVGDVISVAFPGRSWLRARFGQGTVVALWGRYCAACIRWAVRGGASPVSPNQ